MNFDELFLIMYSMICFSDFWVSDEFVSSDFDFYNKLFNILIATKKTIALYLIWILGLSTIKDFEE